MRICTSLSRLREDCDLHSRPIGDWRAGMAGAREELPLPPLQRCEKVTGVILPGEVSQLFDLQLDPTSGTITEMNAHDNEDVEQTMRLLALPSLCHPHIHLDKPHLLTHPPTNRLKPRTGDFQEALSKTATAKSYYSYATLQKRMQALLVDSSRAGVTHMRGFAEVDTTVRFLALEAALDMKQQWAGRMQVQLCAFAQDPVFSGTSGPDNRALLEEALVRDGIEVLGSTPYVEADVQSARANVEWAVQAAIKSKLHLDLHLDYNVDEDSEPLIWWVLEVLRREEWIKHNSERTVCLGHCTRLTLFKDSEWTRLREAVKGLPIHFIGLPTSDLFMMGRPSEREDGSETFGRLQDRKRCTLQIPAMIHAGFDACLGVNNVGNAFTPYGSADPLTLAQWGVGIYQDGTAQTAELLFDCVSRRAKKAIGVVQSDDSDDSRERGELLEGDNGNLLLIGRPSGKEYLGYRRRTEVCEVVWDAGADRRTMLNGNWVRME